MAGGGNAGVPGVRRPFIRAVYGRRLERPLTRILRRNGLDRPNAPVVVQSFETSNLRYLAKHTHFHIAQLIDASGAPYDLEQAGAPRTYADLVTRKGLHWVARYADSIGTNAKGAVGGTFGCDTPGVF